MPVYHNGQQITAVYAGSTNVTDLYAGSTNVSLGGGSPPPSGDPYFSNVVLLLQDGFTDLSNSSHTVTNTNVSTSYTQVPVSGMASSWQFGGSANYVTVSDSPDLTLPGDFTMEGWLWHDSTNGQSYPNVFCIGTYNAADSFGIEHENYVNPTTYGRYLGSGWRTGTSPQAGDDKWIHFCYQRSGTSVVNFLNGVPWYTDTSSLSINATSTLGIRFGQLVGYATSSNWKGYMAGIRLTKGVARYASAGFTPPTAPHPTS
jgi:hypothetical protein